MKLGRVVGLPKVKILVSKPEKNNPLNGQKLPAESELID